MPTAHYTMYRFQRILHIPNFLHKSVTVYITLDTLCIAELTELRFLDTVGLVTEHWRTRLEGLLKVIKVKHKSGSRHSAAADASFHLKT